MKEKLQKFKHIFVSPSLRSLWLWSAGHRLQLLLLSLGEMLAAVLGLAFTVATKNIIDAAVSGSAAQVKLCAGLLIGVILLQLAVNNGKRLAGVHVTATYRRQMRTMMVQRVLGKRYSELAGIHSGELTGTILTDTNTVTSAIVTIVPTLLFLVTQLLGAVLLLYRFSRGFVLVLIAICLAGAAFMTVAGTRMKRYHRDSREKEDRVLAAVSETMQNLRILKASESEARAGNTIRDRQQEYVSAELRRGRFAAAVNTGLGVLFRFTWLYAMLWGCAGIVRGSLSYGTLTAMLQLVGQVQGPINNLSGLVAQLYGAVSSAERMDELLARQDEEDDPAPAEPGELYAALQDIVIDDLGFSYGRDPVLAHRSFTIRPGDLTAITGHSGIGKSTFFLLLMGLYAPTEGSIRFRFRDGKEEPAGRRTRRLFAYVPQGNALFSGTIRENVALFRPSATEDEVWNALRLACIDDFVAGLDTGLDTLLGERGLGLSEGQSQRIAIARAFLSEAPILLLDEATSALDEQTEAKLLDHIAALSGRTCLVVTHRPAALKICTQHLDLE